MRPLGLGLLLFAGIVGVGRAQTVPAVGPPPARQPYFILGADVSYLRDLESKGIVFKDGGKAEPGLDILHSHGYNWVRLRIMNEPTKLPNTLAYTLAEAKAAKAAGFRLLLHGHALREDPFHNTFVSVASQRKVT